MGAWGSQGMDNLSIPCPLWACTGAPDQLQGLQLVVLLLPNFLQWLAQGPAPLGLEKRKGKKRLPLYDFPREIAQESLITLCSSVV